MLRKTARSEFSARRDLRRFRKSCHSSRIFLFYHVFTKILHPSVYQSPLVDSWPCSGAGCRTGTRKREKQTRNLGFPVYYANFFGVTRPRGNARKRDFRLVAKLHIAFLSLNRSQQQEKKHTSRGTVKMSHTNALIANLGR